MLADRFDEFISNCQEIEFDGSLLTKVHDILIEAGNRETLRDREIAELTKHFEIEVRGIGNSFVGGTLPVDRSFGRHLISALIENGLITGGSNPEPLLHQCYYIMRERNAPHHDHIETDWTHFLTLFLVASESLRILRSRLLTMPRRVSMSIVISPNPILAGDLLNLTAQVRDPLTGHNVISGTATAQVTLGDGIDRTYSLQLNNRDSSWQGQIPTSSWAPGPATIIVNIVDGANRLTARNPGNVDVEQR